MTKNKFSKSQVRKREILYHHKNLQGRRETSWWKQLSWGAPSSQVVHELSSWKHVTSVNTGVETLVPGRHMTEYQASLYACQLAGFQFGKVILTFQSFCRIMKILTCNFNWEMPPSRCHRERFIFKDANFKICLNLKEHNLSPECWNERLGHARHFPLAVHWQPLPLQGTTDGTWLKHPQIKELIEPPCLIGSRWGGTQARVTQLWNRPGTMWMLFQF